MSSKSENSSWLWHVNSAKHREVQDVKEELWGQRAAVVGSLHDGAAEFYCFAHVGASLNKRPWHLCSHPNVHSESSSRSTVTTAGTQDFLSPTPDALVPEPNQVALFEQFLFSTVFGLSGHLPRLAGLGRRERTGSARPTLSAHVQYASHLEQPVCSSSFRVCQQAQETPLSPFTLLHTALQTSPHPPPPSLTTPTPIWFMDLSSYLVQDSRLFPSALGFSVIRGSNVMA